MCWQLKSRPLDRSDVVYIEHTYHISRHTVTDYA